MMKKDYIEVFKHNTATLQYDEIIKEALECLDEFGKYFEKEDLEGMDSCLHFPHYILSGNEVICWNESGNLPKTFFEDLKKNGFKRTIVTCREVITVSDNKDFNAETEICLKGFPHIKIMLWEIFEGID